MMIIFIIFYRVSSFLDSVRKNFSNFPFLIIFIRSINTRWIVTRREYRDAG